MKNCVLVMSVIGIILSASTQAKLVQYWPLDETAADLTELEVGGTSTTASLINWAPDGVKATFVKGGSTNDPTPVYEEDVFNNSLGTQVRFARIELGNVAPGTEPFTICFWFKRHSQYISGHDVGSSQEHILSGNQSQEGRWALNTNSFDATDETYRIDWWHSGGLAASDLARLNSDQWYHFAVTRDTSGSMSFYLDGSYLGSGIDTASYTCGSRGVFLGRDPGLTSNGARGFTGQFDDVRIYDNPLSSSEIQAIISETGYLAYAPEPSNDKVDMLLPVTCRWQAPADVEVASYEFSISTNYNDLDPNNPLMITSTNIGNVTEYVPADLVIENRYYWRVDTVDTSNNIYLGNIWSFTTAAEYSNPYPADGSTDQPRNAFLTWDTVLDISSATQSIYAGSDPENLLYIADVATASTSFDADLDWGVTYYWQVVYNDGANTIASDIWSFTIADGPECSSEVGAIDLNGDCAIDFEDIVLIAAHWSECAILNDDYCE